MAISIDIENAFNSIPWSVITKQLIRKRFPLYIVEITSSYLSDRFIVFPTASGRFEKRRMHAGVPQGSVLGPLLLNLSYDWALGAVLQPQTRLLCYADDTLLLSLGVSPTLAAWRATASAAALISRIQRLGLKISASKTMVALFYSESRRVDPVSVNILEQQIQATETLKYLGVIFDRRLTFKSHYEYIERKAANTMRALWRVMPNLRGPTEEKRKLYVNIIHAILLYAAPVWSDTFGMFKTYQMSIRRVQRCMALRVISAYRTVSYEAATLLARIPPFDLLASRNNKIYIKKKELRESGEITVDKIRDL